MKRVWIALLLAALAVAQDKPKEQKDEPKTVQRLFILKYADPSQIEGMLRVFTSSLTTNREMHALAVTGTPETIATIEDALKRLDVPSAAPKDIDMTVYLLSAADAPATAAPPMPKDLDPVVTQLKNTFPFKNYDLLDVLTFRTRTGQQVSTTSSGGSFQIGNRNVAVITSLRINSISVQGDGSTLRVDRLNTSIRVPQPTGPAGDTQFQYYDLGMQTDLDIKEGQKVVVGRLGISHDKALFLVMTAKIL
jgi:hypothetical protein